MSPFVRPAVIRLGDRFSARSVFLILLGIFTATFAGMPEDPLSELDFQATRSLARGHFVLGDTPEAQALVHAGTDVVLLEDGSSAADRPIGGALASVPLYWLGELAASLLSLIDARHDGGSVQQGEYFAHLLVGWRNAVGAALLGALVVLSSRRVGVGRRHAWLAGLAFGLSTYVWPQARGWSIDVPAALFPFLAFHLLLRAREHFERLLRPERVDLLGIGFALTASVLVRPHLVLPVLFLGVATVITVFAGYRRLAKFALFLRKTWRFGHWADLTWTAVPLFVGVALVLAAPQAFGGALLVAPSNEPFEDVVLLLVSPGRGLLWFAPLVLLAPYGCLVALRRGARTWPIVAVLVVLPIVWSAHPPPRIDHAWGFGPGGLLPALPFLWLFVAVALDKVERIDWLRRVGRGLVVLGLLTSLSGALVDTATYQDLLIQEARGRTAADLHRQTAWDLRAAEPWAHWRILRHRLAGLGESFPSDAIFLAGNTQVLEPHRARDRGFGHVAWVDLHERRGLRPHALLLVALSFFVAGCGAAVRAFDRALP